ncbi:MAG: hypothetical protein P8K69_01195 [Flavobacteriales bacterium]|nr:hypothetical protein [Flavobacteriales bacterium]|tara:strand:+ start:134 stop:370 length:237 start_codon:yes stop_codon:yes gene_type:complete
MSKKAQLIWNFNGQDGLKTAEHHLVHLKEFAQMEAVPILKSGVNKTSPLSCEAFIVVEMEWVEKLRTQLKPNKGFAVD